MKRVLLAALAWLMLAAPVAAQWQVPQYSVPIGRGSGTGFSSALCTSAQLLVGQAAAPLCKTITGDVTIDAAGATAIGATKVTSAMLNADVFSTAHTWAGQQTFVAPVLGTPASGTLTNATGLPIATGVSGLASGITSWLATSSSANLATAVTDETGSGPLVFGTSPTLTTPSLGVAAATSINKVAITAPATGATLTIPNGVTLTGPAASGTAMTLENAEDILGVKKFYTNRMTFAGSTSGITTLNASAIAGTTTLTLPAATDTLVGKATTDTLTNKTFDTAGAGNSLSINGLAATANTGTGSVVRATSPTLVTPALGTPASGTLTNATGLPVSTGISGLGTGIATALAVNTGSAGAPVLFNGALGTPSSGTATNITGLPISTGVSGLASGIASWLATSSSANLATALTDETGSGAAVFGTAPTISAPIFTGTTDVQGTVKLSSFVTSTQLTADANDYTATDGSNTCTTKGTLRISTDASHNVTGLSCGQAEGDVRIIYNVGSFDVVLTNEDAGSTAGNRFLVGGDMTLLTNYSVTVKYDGVSSRWRAITTPGAGGGGGGVTSVTIAGSGGVTATGTCTITTSGTCTVTGFVSKPQGRLYLFSGEPVPTVTRSAKTDIYYGDYVGNQLPIYDGTSMVPTVITGGEISASTTDTTKSPAAIGASKVNDWFVWNDSGTIRLSHGPDWTSDTARSAGTALVMVNGIWLNNASITNGPAASRGTYVGTTRSNGSSQLDWIYGGISTGGTRSWFGVWNAYNHVEVVAFSGDDTNSWTYATATWRNANGGNVSHAFIRGLDEDGVHVVYDALMTVAATNAYVGIGLDSVTAITGTASISNNASTTMVSPKYSGLPGIGFHAVYALERSSGATSTFYGDIGTPTLVQTGLHFRMHM